MFHSHILAELGIYVLDTLHQSLILDNLFFARITQTLKKHHRIVLHVMIKSGIKVAEQVTGLKVPYPPQVVRNLIQALQLFRKA